MFFLVIERGSLLAGEKRVKAPADLCVLNAGTVTPCKLKTAQRAAAWLKRSASGVLENGVWRLFCLFFPFLYGTGLLVFAFIFIFGNNDEVHRMDLGHFQFHIAFGTAYNFAFLNFVLVQVNLGIALWASGHGVSLLW